ncbi:Aste57867_10506 [Aphanomyces stellatus]|uniref:Aste57867_10506 protein n=1 Tax=Aphanomyces stellatus TaxID=120398 RepID=A0A485KR03_9STRA|nr:hypothetical protein As57867_010466 [Aphanomyces stellatus]VFT87379.1 Aste57867_10506 [Aphanomyces stellatus]
MIEEPLYVIFNVALAKAWGATPPNAEVGPCRGNATSNDPVGTYPYNRTMSICDSFPMYMQIDYIRIYQDTDSMFIGCDPPTHPTKQWIDGHIKWYTDANNPLVRVDGGATCKSDNDCQANIANEPSGKCVARRCQCVANYGGPRCTKYVGSKTVSIDGPNYFGPKFIYPALLGSVAVAMVVLTCVWRSRREAKAATLAVANRKPTRGDDDALADEAEVKAEPGGAAVTQTTNRRFYAPGSSNGPANAPPL